MSVRKGDDVLAGGNATRVDSALSPTSINPVQNHVITAALQTKQDNITAGSGIVKTDNEIAVGNLDCGTMS